MSTKVPEDVHGIIWGPNTHEDAFRRWCQGFHFSTEEPLALQQFSGGPCAVIACVQAHIFRLAYFERHTSDEIIGNASVLLLDALLDLLRMAAATDDSDVGPYRLACIEEPIEQTEVDFNWFRSNVRFVEMHTIEELRATLMSLQPLLQGRWGVLSCLYSLVLTHGSAALEQAMADETTYLIEPVHGCASQCLTNLMLTGCATPYLFDGQQDLSGYVLTGICHQPPIGLLSIMEYMRYIEVGWHLKNPRHPIWVLASENHLTVLCSKDAALIERSAGGPLQRAEREFQQLDAENAGFIMADRLQDFLASLDLPTDADYVRDTTANVDPEGLGVLIKTNLLRFLFPKDFSHMEGPFSFPVIHYNGLVGPGNRSTVRFATGEATVDDFTGRGTDSHSNDSALLRCLRTKWPTVTLRWDGPDEPTLD